MHDLFVAPTFLSLATMLAARRAGLYGADAGATLLVTNNSAIPEVQPGVSAVPGFARVAGQFAGVIDLNTLIYPYHPGRFDARDEPREALRAAIAEACGGAAPTSITLQSIHVKPSAMLADLFPDARLHVVADGLMSYGPTRVRLPDARVARVDRLLHADLVPGVTPMLLSEHGVPRHPISMEDVRAVIADVAAESGVPERAAGERPDAILLGQYLATLGLLTEAQERDLHLDMVRVAAARGARRIVLKPHPSAPPALTERAQELAAALGVTLEVADARIPAEVLYERWRPRLAVGCFSTGIATAAAYGLDVCSVGTEAVARALPRFEDSNRVPLALTHARHERAEVRGDEVTFATAPDADPQLLVDGLSAAMQPGTYEAPAGDAVGTMLARHPEIAPFFSRGAGRRLRAVGRLARRAARRADRAIPEGPRTWFEAARAATVRLR